MARTTELEVPVVMVTDKFDKQIQQLEDKINKTEKRKLNVETKLGTQEADLQNQIKRIEELKSAYAELNNLKDKADKHEATFFENIRLLDLQNEYGTLEKIQSSIGKAEEKQRHMELGVMQTKMRYEELSNEVIGYRNKINSVNFQRHAEDVERMKESFRGVGSNIQNIIFKLGRMALGIIGIRTALAGMRRLSSELANYDKTYAANLEYIRFLLAQAVAPVLRYIVSLAGEVLALINAIFHLITGRTLFGVNASRDAFKEMKESTGKVKDNIGGAR